MVRIQLACGTGRRCALEIEITGTDENVVNTGWCSADRACRAAWSETELAAGRTAKRVVVEMEVQKVEFFIVAFLSYALQHHHMQRVGIADGSVEAQRLRPCRVKFRRGLESPLANSVTSFPSATSSSVSQCTTRSVPPYNLGGTASVSGATCAMRIYISPLSL